MIGSFATRRHLPVVTIFFSVLVMALASADPEIPAALPIDVAPTCTTLGLPVGLSDAAPKSYSIFGQFCYRGRDVPTTVQLLVSGQTYNRTYWDFPVNNGYYSYVRAATGVGYATFAVDRIGYGESSHPPAALVNGDSGTSTMHQVVQQLRSGAVHGVHFKKVIWVGHSLGVLYAWTEIAKYHDVDGLIATSLLHSGSPSGLAPLAHDLQPADRDPKFAGHHFGEGYITSTPGTREQLSYYAPGADPQVVAADDATRDVATTSEPTVDIILLPPSKAPSNGITVPVLVVVGQRDPHFCEPDSVDCSTFDTVRQEEAPFYLRASSLSAVVIPDTGHSLNLHRTAPLFFAVALTWSKTFIPAER